MFFSNAAFKPLFSNLEWPSPFTMLGSSLDRDTSTAVDKVALSKSINSPQVAGNHVIATRNRPNLAQLLNFKTSRKSRNTFVAANSSPGKYAADGISSIKKALDFSFHDVEGLLHLRGVQLHFVVYKNKIFADFVVVLEHSEVNFCKADSELFSYVE
ncbi:hypothetical protein RJT34_25066 [Clitoria ternatea]|uniref:CWZF3/5/7 THD domain-containing protein n=1 Tax=Clitoria ternatea TaxID=43366 RepID=A0AAN9FP88_CLITE